MVVYWSQVFYNSIFLDLRTAKQNLPLSFSLHPEAERTVWEWSPVIQKDIAGQDLLTKVMNVMFIRKKLNGWVQKWRSASICFKDFPDFTLYLEVCAICQELTELCVSFLYFFLFIKWTYGRSFLWPYGWVCLDCLQLMLQFL